MTGAPVVDEAAEGDRWVTARIGAAGFRTEIETRAHRLPADEPVPLGGTDSGPTPYELLLGVLASCTAMTLRIYADRKGWPLAGAVVRMRSARSHEPDCEQCETETVGIGRIGRTVELSGALTDEQRQRLREIADRCPVKQTLERGMEIVDASG